MDGLVEFQNLIENLEEAERVCKNRRFFKESRAVRQAINIFMKLGYDAIEESEKKGEIKDD